MPRFSVVLIAAAALSFPAAALQTSGASGQSTTGMSKADEMDPIGLTSTGRQMVAWSIAGIAENRLHR